MSTHPAGVTQNRKLTCVSPFIVRAVAIFVLSAARRIICLAPCRALSAADKLLADILLRDFAP